MTSGTRVLYVSDSTTVSGAEQVLLAHLDRFGRPGWAPHVFYHHRNVRLREALDARGCRATPTTGYSEVLLETTLRPASWAHFARAFRHVHRDLRRVMRTERTEILHAISYPAVLYAATAARRARVPMIWHEHNIKRMHAVNRRLFRYAAGPCTAVIGPSAAVTETFRDAHIPAAKIRTLYNGIDLTRFRIDDEAARRVRASLGLRDRDRAVALPGQLIPIKGHRTVLAMAPHILARVPETHFFFIGARENPPYEAELLAAIRAAGLERIVHFTGWRTDVPDVLRAMDVIVLATERPEPAALSLMEAMAMERPVVAVRNGGTAEIVADGETGFLFPQGDVSAAALLVTRCLEDADVARRLGQAGRRRVEAAFGLERHLREVEALYAEARQGRSAHWR